MLKSCNVHIYVPMKPSTHVIVDAIAMVITNEPCILLSKDIKYESLPPLFVIAIKIAIVPMTNVHDNAILFVCARASDLESGSAFEISNSKIKNLEKSSILFNMRSFLKEKMEKHVEDL